MISCVTSSSALHDSSFRWEAGSAPLGAGRGEEVRGCHTSGQYPSYQSSLVILNYPATPKQSMFNHPIRKEDRGCEFTLVSHLRHHVTVQFSSVAQSCLTLCDPMNRSTPGLLSITNSRSLLKLMSIESVMPPAISSSAVPFSSCPQSLPASGSFQMSQLFT